MAIGKARVARKATKRHGKGSRWIKGQSSSSNPETNKHREAAKKGFFQLNTGTKSTLTTDALVKHDQLQAEDDLCLHSQSLSISDDGDNDDAKTFASNWTTCTNPSFESFLKKWQPNSAVHKDRLAVLAAVTDVIKQNNSKETETAYFAALLTTLNVLDSPDLVAAGVSILSMVIKRVPSSVLKSKFSESCKLFQELLGRYVEGENISLLRGLIGCLSVVLRAQDLSAWSHSSTVQSYMVVLSFVTYTKPRVRKAAQHAVCAILKGSCFMLTDSHPSHHPAANQTAKFCIQQLESQATVASSTTLQILNFLQNVISVFSQHYVKSCCEAILRWMTINNSNVTMCSFQALNGLFVNRPSRDSLSSELNAQLINAFYDYQPSPKDTHHLLMWITVVMKAHLNLLRLDCKLCLGHMIRFFSVLCRLWPTPKTEIRSCITATLKNLVLSFDESLVSQLEMQLKGDLAVSLQKIFENVENCLGYQYHEVWSSVFQIFSVFFDVLGRACHPFMKKCLKSLADLRNSPNFKLTNELDYAIGNAVRAFGPRVVLESIPLNLESDGTTFEQSWLIPVLRDNVQGTELIYFKEYFWPLLDLFHQRAFKYQNEGNEALQKTYEILAHQVWSLLPSFCTSPTDLTKSFKAIAKDLGKVLSGNWADYKLHILAALRLLISKNLSDETSRAELSKYAKNYLPILFNLYTKPPASDETSREGYRLAVFDTVKVYLEITDRDLCGSLFENGLKISGSKDPFSRNAILDLLRALLPYINKELVGKLYEICVSLLRDEDRTTQKKAYRALEELCMGKSDACQEFIRKNVIALQNTLATSLSTTVPSAMAPRMRCLNHIVLQLSEENKEFLILIIPEVISCIKENAKKVRLAALDLIVNIGKKFIEFSDKDEKATIEDYVGILLAGLAGSTHLICATVVAVGHVACYFKEKISNSLLRLILNSIDILGGVKTRAIVSAVLDFIKALLSCLSGIMLASNIEKIMDILKHLSKESQMHFRIKMRRIFQRLIRDVGYEMVRDLAPANYQKLLTYIRKQEARTKKKSSLEEAEENEEEFHSKPQTIDELLQDSSSDDEAEASTTSKAGKKSKTSTWIQEKAETEIVDLLDPKVSKNILATKPEKDSESKAKSKDDFKIAPDGRMIIVDEEDIQEEKSNIMEGVSESKILKRKWLTAEDDDDSDKELTVSLKNGTMERPNNKGAKNKKLSYGEEYKAKKAGGDIKRKGKPDPYAYVPLEIQSLNKRKRAKLAGKFKNVVRSARKGARQGKQARMKSRRNKT